MLKLIADNRSIKVLPYKKIYTSDCFAKIFDRGYKVIDNIDLMHLEPDYHLILDTGRVITDWETATYYDDDGEEAYYIISDGIEYTEDDIVFEVSPDELERLIIARSVKKPIFVSMDGGKTSHETPGIRLIRNNMKEWSTRTKRLYQERQARNKKVK